MMVLLRSLAFNIVMFSTGAALSMYGHALVRVRPERLIGLGMLWARICLGALRMLCGVRIEVTGREMLPEAGPALIAAQHQSAFDTMVWLGMLQRPAYVLKQELRRLPLLGPLLVPSGFIAVDRAGGAAALRAMLADCRRAVADGRQIVIFPEGTRVAPGARGVLQPGVVALAKSLHLPIIPAATNSGLFWGRQAFRKYPGTLRIKIYPPIPEAAGREAALSTLARHFYETGVDNSVERAAPGPGVFVNNTPERLD